MKIDQKTLDVAISKILKPGDSFTIWGGNTLIAEKVNKKTVKSTSGTIWKFSEITLDKSRISELASAIKGLNP